MTFGPADKLVPDAEIKMEASGVRFVPDVLVFTDDEGNVDVYPLMPEGKRNLVQLLTGVEVAYGDGKVTDIKALTGPMH